MIKLKKWHVRGYAGFSDCDGEQDYNLDYFLYVSDKVDREDVEAMILNKYKSMRCIELNIKLVQIWEGELA